VTTVLDRFPGFPARAGVFPGLPARACVTRRWDA